jgi:hypothetical protein
MHTTHFKIDGQPYTVHHNGDYSGDVIIALAGGDEPYVAETELRPIPFQLMEKLVAEKVRDERISALEQMEPKRLLGLTDV